MPVPMIPVMMAMPGPEIEVHTRAPIIPIVTVVPMPAIVGLLHPARLLRRRCEVAEPGIWRSLSWHGHAGCNEQSRCSNEPSKLSFDFSCVIVRGVIKGTTLGVGILFLTAGVGRHSTAQQPISYL